MSWLIRDLYEKRKLPRQVGPCFLCFILNLSDQNLRCGTTVAALIVIADIVPDVERPPQAHKSRSTVPSEQRLMISSDISKILPLSQSVPFKDHRFTLPHKAEIHFYLWQKKREKERKRVRKTN